MVFQVLGSLARSLRIGLAKIYVERKNRKNLVFKEMEDRERRIREDLISTLLDMRDG